MKPWLRRYGDLLLALALAVTMTLELLAWLDEPSPRAIAAGLLGTLPLALRRPLPLLSALLALGGITVLEALQPGFDNDSGSLVAVFAIALYSLGRHARRLEAILGAVFVGAVMVHFLWTDPGSSFRDLGDIAFTLAFVGSPWGLGLAIRLRREREAALHARNEALRAEQEELARRAVTEERSRIARELHDVVSHAISVTVLQARGARRLLDPSATDVRRALDAIEQTNTAALGDMRRLLAVLRDTEEERADHLPQPSLAHLDDLVRQVDESGVPVSLAVDGDRQPVPPGVDLSAYRIIQEALTNVIKHAGDAAAEVRLHYQPDALELSVRDTGLGDDVRGTGHGLIGIRERVAVVGGEVTMGPGPEGGFEVRARLPFALEAT